jgi:hypothetical protein
MPFAKDPAITGCSTAISPTPIPLWGTIKARLVRSLWALT